MLTKIRSISTKHSHGDGFLCLNCKIDELIMRVNKTLSRWKLVGCLLNNAAVYTNRKVTMVAGVSFRNVKNGSKARMVKKSTKLSPQSTSHVPFFASPDVLPFLATQAHLE